MKQRRAGVLRLVPMIVVMGTIFFLSHQPGDRLHLPQLPGIDKWTHLAAYGTLAATVLFAFDARRKSARPLHVVGLTVVFCLLYGISDEFHQSFIVGRTASIYDLLADGCGALVSCAAWLKWRHKIPTIGFLPRH